MRNHTATHLLHAVLREVLGKQVRQLGSLVHPDRLRFDYSFSRPLTEEESAKIESRVNEEILKDIVVQKEEKDTEAAKQEGAIAFFGEKYGDRVRVVTVPGVSKEFCGGTHCERTGQIGTFVIMSDSSIASGVRRIEALTGEGALRYVQTLRSQVRLAAEKLGATPSELVERIEKLQEKARKLEKEGRTRSSPQVDPEEILKRSVRVGTCHLVAEKIEEAGREELRRISDLLRSRAKRTVWILCCRNGNKVHFLVGLSADLKEGAWDARPIAKEIAPLIRGSGGGRKDLAEGGGADPEALDKKWAKLIQVSKGYLESKG
jgi:alanyl-tRNA synthetase